MPIPRFAIACDEWRSHAGKRARPEKSAAVCVDGAACSPVWDDQSLKLFKRAAAKQKALEEHEQQQDPLLDALQEPQDCCFGPDFELGPPPPCPPALCRQKAMDAGCPLKQAAISLAKKCAALRPHAATGGGAPPTACFARLSLSRTRSRPAESWLSGRASSSLP